MAAAFLAIRDGVIPASVGTTSQSTPSTRSTWSPASPRTAAVRTALVLARGQGGFNSAVVVRAVDE